jgi:hypothetical protein
MDPISRHRHAWSDQFKESFYSARGWTLEGVSALQRFSFSFRHIESFDVPTIPTPNLLDARVYLFAESLARQLAA